MVTGRSRSNPGEPVELILSTTWLDRRSTQPRPASARFAKMIAAMATDWCPPVPVPGAHETEFRRRLSKAPSSLREATMARFGLDLLLVWWVGDGHEPEPDRMLSAPHIGSFQDALDTWGYSRATRNAYIPALNSLAKFGNPAHMEEWTALGLQATQKTTYAMPYSDPEVRALFLCAWSQPTTRLRDGMLGLLYLGLAVGLYHAPMTHVTGADVRELDDGSARIKVGNASQQVRPRFNAGILALAARVGKERLVPGATGKNKTSILKSELVLDEDGPALKVERLVATYRWWLGRHVGPDALVRECGINALIHLAEIYKHAAVPNEPLTMPDRGSDDLVDGPWVPDWPARHHRGAETTQ